MLFLFFELADHIEAQKHKECMGCYISVRILADYYHKLEPSKAKYELVLWEKEMDKY
jgi:hypothetical protein